MKRSVTVHIAGHRYVLRSDSEEETVRKLATYVDGRIREIQKQTRTADTQSLAVLAALQIAEELLAERRARSDLKKKVREKSEALLAFIERVGRV